MFSNLYFSGEMNR